MVESSGSEYTSNDIKSMALQIPPTERGGNYESLGEFSLEDPDEDVDLDDGLDYLFKQVIDEDPDVDIAEALEAQYRSDAKYEDTSSLLDKK